MTELRQRQMTGEQWVMETRTADPATTLEGERWIREDLNDGDKIATLRVDAGDTIYDVPIFPLGTAVDSVSEALRVRVNGATGYIPIAPVADANYPDLRMQHNSQLHGYHDRVEPGSAIPDGVTDHWPGDEGSGTTAVNSEGTVDITLNNGGTWENDSRYQGGTAPTFDGADDWFRTGQQIPINGQELSVAGWVNISSVDTFARVFSCAASDTEDLSQQNDGWAIYYGTESSTFNVAHVSGGSNGIAVSVSTPPFDQDLFIGLAVSGDTANLYIWDATQQIRNASGSHARSQTSSEYLSGFAGDSNYAAGSADAMYASTSTALAESDFETLWNDTKDGRI